ncbi:MAG: ABC transporter ATP-binding protein [Frankiaceae bacterium]
MTLLDTWRGVAAEDHADELTAPVSALLRARTRRLLSSLARPHRKGIVVAVLTVVLMNAAMLVQPFLVAWGIDRGIADARAGRGHAVLVTAVVLVVVAALVQAACRRAFLGMVGTLGQAMLLELRRRVFDHVLRLSVSFHERYTSGRVISRLTSDMDAINELLDEGLTGLITAVLSVVTIAVVIVLLDWPLGVATLAVFPLLIWLTVWFRRRSEATYRRTREAIAMVIVHFVESLAGIRAVQAFRREPRNQQIFAELNDRYRKATADSFMLIGIYGPAVKMLGNLTIALVLLYGGWRAMQGEMTIGVLTAFLLYLRQFFEPMVELSQFYNSFQSAAAALEKLSGVLDEQAAVPPPAHPVAMPAPRGDVAFESVRFGYGESRIVLPGLDLRVPAGQTVALVGATGAGKSTVARLLARFYDPLSGTVRLDGVDLRDIDDADLRRTVVMVTQENFLFSGTIADNIALGRPGATREEVESAAAALGAHEFIAALPEGYDTEVRKRGGRLSSGQRQLVAFARAFLADPAVLILDEATSSLDVPSERAVQRALRTVLQRRTALIIAHRLTTVEIADRVLVMTDGQLVEDGSPAELLTGTGRYAALHQAWRESLA